MLNEAIYSFQISLFLKTISPRTVIYLSILAQISTFRRNINEGPAFAANHEELYPLPHHCRIGDIPSVASPVLKNKSERAKSRV
jgi:hypothetical protein